jgi:16S rRNA (guanine1207-N2)-methyltransferase
LSPDPAFVVYGQPPAALAAWPAGAVQTSPLAPGSAPLSEVAAESLDGAVVAAPPGTLERRYVLALALRALKLGGRLTALAPKDKGGSRLGKELAAFGCAVDEMGQKHQRICRTVRPALVADLEEAIEAGRPRLSETLGLWTQPGVFSWDRPDPGSLLLIQTLPPLSGRGADLGAGLGLLSRAVLVSPGVTELALVELDGRAFECAKRNVVDPRAAFHWQDARTGPELAGVDFVVMNPPFHDGGAEDRSLGQAFIRRAHGALRRGGALWLVANRHLPYEGVLGELFAGVSLRAQGGGFKVFEARK